MPGDHQVDNRALVEALLTACRNRNVSFHPAAAVSVEVAAGRASGVSLDAGGTLSCGSVVLAAGSAIRDIGGLEGAELPPVRAVKGQLIHLRGPEPLLCGNIRGIDAYLVGRADGRLVLGATVEERGPDLRVTAGGLLDLLRAGYELVPGITELEVVEATAGSRPATPDNAPLIGWTGIEGVIVATGHYRNGVLLTPVTAEAVASLVQGRAVEEVVAPFRPARFVEERARG